MNYGERNSEDTRFENPQNNLNLENWAPERDSKSIGNRVISSNDLEVDQESSTDNFGQIVDLPSPIQASQIDSQNGASVETSKNLQSIIGDHFSDTVMTEINRAENELSQTENISNFYDEIRDMAEIARGSWAA